jgi:hypothetical protein
MAKHFEVTVLTTPCHHHYLNVDVPDEVRHSDSLQWIGEWLSNTEFAGSRIIRILDTNVFKIDVNVL